MDENKFHIIVQKILKDDDRYSIDAYVFVSEAVGVTAKKLERLNDENHHISGQELLEGISDYAITKFGPLAGEVLNYWGINNSRGIGDIVFNMVNNNLLRASENDSIKDFENGPDFDKTFRVPFKSKDKREVDIPKID